MLAVVAALGASACANLPPIDDGVCGNHVTDGGEDCDESSYACHPPGHPQQCRFACDESDATLTPVFCPLDQGYACGVDKVCRRAQGRFTFGDSDVTGSTVELAAASFDADGRDDLFRGTRETSSVHFYGDNFGTHAATSIAREPWGPPPMLGDLDGDGSDDMVFGIQLGETSGSGLAVYRSTGARAFESQTYQTVPLPTDFARGLRLDVLTLSYDVVVGFVEGDAPNELDGLIGLALGREIATMGLLPNVGNALAAPNLVGLAAGHFYTSPTSLCEDVALTVADNTDPKVWVVETCTTVNNKIVWPVMLDIGLVHALSLPAGVKVTAPKWHANAATLRSVLHRADVNADGRPDLVLVAQAQGEVDSNLYVAFGHPDGGFSSEPDVGSNPVNDMFSELMPYAQGCDGWSMLLVAGDLTDDGWADFVTDRGILLRTVGGYFKTECDATWTSAAVADFDRNGIEDVVAARGVTTLDDADDLANGLDVRLSTGDGAFTRSTLSTAGPALWVVAGDFDGDSVSDVGWVQVEVDTDFETLSERPPDTIQAAFGRTFGSFEEPITLGTLTNVRQVITGRLAGGDGTSDMLMFAGPPDGMGVAVVAGSSSRQLVAPFTFTIPPPEALVPTVTSLAFGQLVDEDEEINSAFAAMTKDDIDETAVRLWLVQQPGPDMELRETELASDGGGLSSPFNCPDCVLVAADLDPPVDGSDYLDEILVLGSLGGKTELSVFQVEGSGLERKLTDRQVAVDFADFNFFSGQSHEFEVAPSPLVRDLDFEGGPEVLVLAEAADSNVTGLVVLWNDATGSLTEATFVTDPTVRVVSFAVLNVDADDTPEIVVAIDVYDDVGLETGNVVLLDVDVESRRITPLLEGAGVRVWWDEDESEPVWAESLTAGDFDGDGVDDLVVGGLFGYHILKGEAFKP